MRSDINIAALRFGTHIDFQVRGGQVRCFFRPLNQAHRIRVEVLPKTGFFQFLRIKEPIKIKVIQV